MSHVTGFAGALLAEYRLETGCDPLEDRKAYEEWLLRWTTRNEKAKWKALFKKVRDQRRSLARQLEH
jgi:hypothetical protein